MTAFATLAGHRLTTVRAIIPMYGAWTADVVLADSIAIPATAATFAVGDLSMVGTAYRMADFAGSRSARLVGGYGGWAKTLSRKAYQDDSSVRLSMVLGDAAAESGERIELEADGTVGQAFVREAAPASRVLRQLAGSMWWVHPDGSTRTGPRPTGPITSDFTVVGWSGKTGHFTIATETYGDWMPGRSFTTPTVSGTRTVSLVAIEQDNDGKLRLEVLAAT